MSADSVIPNPNDTYSYDRYAYCRNNPVNLTDPSGHLFGIDDLTIGVLLAMVFAGAAIGALIAAVNGGNVLQGALAGAVSGFFTAVSCGGSWAAFAVSQSVNVVLHATKPGQELIAKVGDAIGSQILGDMIVSALVTGATLKATGLAKGNVPEGTNLEQEQEAGTVDLNRATNYLEALKSSQTAAKAAGDVQQVEQCAKEIEQWGKVVKEGSAALERAQLLAMQTAADSSGFGQAPGGATRGPDPRVPPGEVKIAFKVEWSSDGTQFSLNPVALWFAAPVRVGNMDLLALEHTAASEVGGSMAPPYPGWSYVWGTGVCHQSTALYLHRLLGVQVTPFTLTSHWSAMLTTGLYGYYGIWGGLAWTGMQEYLYERSIP
jgi:hypothetical protein